MGRRLEAGTQVARTDERRTIATCASHSCGSSSLRRQHRTSPGCCPPPPPSTQTCRRRTELFGFTGGSWIAHTDQPLDADELDQQSRSVRTAGDESDPVGGVGVVDGGVLPGDHYTGGGRADVTVAPDVDETVVRLDRLPAHSAMVNERVFDSSCRGVGSGQAGPLATTWRGWSGLGLGRAALRRPSRTASVEHLLLACIP